MKALPLGLLWLSLFLVTAATAFAVIYSATIPWGLFLGRDSFQDNILSGGSDTLWALLDLGIHISLAAVPFAVGLLAKRVWPVSALALGYVTVVAAWALLSPWFWREWTFRQEVLFLTFGVALPAGWANMALAYLLGRITRRLRHRPAAA